MGIVTNRITQTLVPGSARDIVFKAIWHSNSLSNKLNRHHATADILLACMACAGRADGTFRGVLK